MSPLDSEATHTETSRTPDDSVFGNATPDAATLEHITAFENNDWYLIQTGVAGVNDRGFMDSHKSFEAHLGKNHVLHQQGNATSNGQPVTLNLLFVPKRR